MKVLFKLIPCSLLMLSTLVSANTLSESSNIEFPEVKQTYLKSIPRYNPIDLIHINIGIKDDDVRQLIGNPHFNEFNSNIWNYVLNIRTPNSKDYIQCQLQIHYDQNDEVKNYYWNNQKCVTLIEQSIKKPEPIIVQQPKTRIFTLSSDLLFDFDSSKLKSSSYMSINKMVSSIKKEYSQIHSIDVVGHTDYLGGKAYNYRLAFRRANTVKNQLLNNGFDAAIINVSSKGESVPLTKNCTSLDRYKAKLCLAPDRRVEVNVKGILN